MYLMGTKGPVLKKQVLYEMDDALTSVSLSEVLCLSSIMGIIVVPATEDSLTLSTSYTCISAVVTGIPNIHD